MNDTEHAPDFLYFRSDDPLLVENGIANGDDVRYLKSTPVREAAEELLKALELAILALNQIASHTLTGQYRNTYKLIPVLDVVAAKAKGHTA